MQKAPAMPMQLLWAKDPAGYEAIPMSSSTRKGSGGLPLRIVGRSGPKATLSRYAMGLGHHHVYLDLANWGGTPEGACRFANKWGPLTTRIPHQKLQDELPWLIELGEAFENYRRISVVARALLENYVRNGVSSLSKADTRVSLFPRGGNSILYGLRPCLLPRRRQSTYRVGFLMSHLEAFCMLEMAIALENGAKIIQCERCRDFKLKATKGPAGRFCSGACRTGACRQRNRKDK